MENTNLGSPDNLESAINSAKSAPVANESSAPQMGKDEEIGFHKGALNTLVSERNELVKIVGNVEAIMQAHMSRLKELGIDLGASGNNPAQ